MESVGCTKFYKKSVPYAVLRDEVRKKYKRKRSRRKK